MTRKNLLAIIADRVFFLLKLPAFWVVTLVGNSFVLVGAFVLFQLEAGKHVQPVSFLDCLSWAVGLVTTIGYGSLIPVTDAGKVMGIIMMVGGTLFLWSYMALLVGALLAPEISLIEREIKVIKKESNLDDRKINDLIAKVETLIQKQKEFEKQASSSSLESDKN